VTLSANLHAALSHEHVQLFEYCTLANPLRDELLDSPINFRGGFIHAPMSLGIGVHVNDEIERKFPFSSGGGHVIA
jgi:L-alanine-DL-glutamate epimerase-like enolase superfamily enzyme